MFVGICDMQKVDWVWTWAGTLWSEFLLFSQWFERWGFLRSKNLNDGWVEAVRFYQYFWGGLGSVWICDDETDKYITKSNNGLKHPSCLDKTPARERCCQTCTRLRLTRRRTCTGWESGSSRASGPSYCGWGRADRRPGWPRSDTWRSPSGWARLFDRSLRCNAQLSARE